MALVKCAECGREISDRSTTCPQCGHPTVSRLDGEPRVPVRKKSRRTLFLVLGGLVVLVVLAALALRPVPRIVAAEMTTDSGCTVFGDFCMNVNCIYQNLGGAGGERRVGAQLLDAASNQVLASRASTLALPAKGVRRLTFSFMEAEVGPNFVGRCSVE
jgi:hypothetical protein